MNILNEYRPDNFDDVIGQDAVVRSLKGVVKSDNPPPAFIFHGPAGTGKTTVARILATELGCDIENESSLMEIDAATHSGVSDMRELSKYQKFSNIGGESRAVIIDECQTLSKSAWDALLKPIEESPNNFYWIFCTTAALKVPGTIKTRCHAYEFSEVRLNDLEELVSDVANEEGIEITPETLRMICQASSGSPRQAIVYLSMCRSAKSKKEVQGILRSGYDHPQVIDLVRYIVFDKKANFSQAMGMLKSIEDINAESLRLVMLNYCANCLLNKPDRSTEKLLSVMESFRDPFNGSEKMAPVIIALGELLI